MHRGPAETTAAAVGTRDVPSSAGWGCGARSASRGHQDRAGGGVLGMFWGAWSELALRRCHLGQPACTSRDLRGVGGPGSCLTGRIPARAPGAPGHVPLQSRLSRPVLGSRPPSVEDVLQDGGCGEHRSLTQSDSDPPVDVYLPGNSRAVGIRATRAASLQRWQPRVAAPRGRGALWPLCLAGGSLPSRGGGLQPRGGTGARCLRHGQSELWARVVTQR